MFISYRKGSKRNNGKSNICNNLVNHHHYYDHYLLLFKIRLKINSQLKYLLFNARLNYFSVYIIVNFMDFRGKFSAVR